MTLSTNSGGLVTVQLHDALLFLEEMKINDELTFLHHLVSSSAQTSQESITGFFKHLFFYTTLAKQFVQWQRGSRVA